jgi:hypothetical protein
MTPILPERPIPRTFPCVQEGDGESAMKKVRPKLSRRRAKAIAGLALNGADSAPAVLCPLCHRPMIPGASLDQHHPVPKSRGGRDTVTMHKICHRAIHAMLNERELAEDFTDFDKLRAHPTLAQFIAWVRKRPPEYYDRTRWSKERRFK